MLATYSTGFAVRKEKLLSSLACSASKLMVRIGLPSSRWAASRSSSSSSSFSLAPGLRRAVPLIFSRRLLTTSRSASASSRLTIAMSRRGSSLLSTCCTFGSLNARTTMASASSSRIFERNWLPIPSPRLAPATRPATSTNFITVGVTFLGVYICASTSSRLSGTSTMAVFGSTVLKAYEATPAPARVSALNRVVVPTFGRPTIPTPRLIGHLLRLAPSAHAGCVRCGEMLAGHPQELVGLSTRGRRGRSARPERRGPAGDRPARRRSRHKSGHRGRRVAARGSYGTPSRTNRLGNRLTVVDNAFGFRAEHLHLVHHDLGRVAAQPVLSVPLVAAEPALGIDQFAPGQKLLADGSQPVEGDERVILDILLAVPVVVLRIAVGSQPELGDGEPLGADDGLRVASQAADQNHAVHHMVLLPLSAPTLPSPGGEGYSSVLAIDH